MITERIDFITHDGTYLPAILWLPERDCTCVLQITHGMTEHIARYASFAREMTTCGIAVAGFDLRGHGENPGSRELAVFAEGDWEASLGDMKCFYDLLHSRFPGVPHFLYGFSLGSFLLREYLGRYFDDPDGAIILGTGHQPGWLLSLMLGIVKGQIKKVGYTGASPLVRQLSFGTYNQNFKPNRTDKDWLCGDTDQLDQFIADPLCRNDFSAGLFYEMLGAMKRTGSSFAYDHWETHIPILLISGQEDPVGNSGKGVRSVYNRMVKTGIESVDLHLLPGARHDVLHEESCGAAKQATELIKNWLLEKTI